MKKIITCTGYHGTGSSIITDYLKEFEEIDSKGEFEFRFIQDPNGIADLEDRLLKNNSRLNSDRAIYEYLKLIKRLNSNYTNRFWRKSIYQTTFKGEFLKISLDYIESLVDIKWKGYWHDFEMRKYNFFIKIMNIILKVIEFIIKDKNKFKSKMMYYSYPIESFYEKTKVYLEQLFEISSEKEIIAFDQLVPCCNIERYLKYFYNIKIIVVDRDPRDLYILNKEVWRDKTVPCENVEIFIKHYSLLREHQKYEDENEHKILRINFEEMIYNYKYSLKKINNFLEIQSLNHINSKQYFDPEKSIKNTQLFNLYPKYEKDIKKIENELSKFCYKFPYVLERKKSEVKEVY